jgi:hypothetical protein
MKAGRAVEQIVGGELLMVSGNRFFPGLLLDLLAVS